MKNLKKALAVGAITITSFPNILFAQEINTSKFKDIDIFSGKFMPALQNIAPMPEAGKIPDIETPQNRVAKYFDSKDSADKALDRVYKKINKMLSDMVDEITRSKNTPPWMWRR